MNIKNYKHLLTLSDGVDPRTRRLKDWGGDEILTELFVLGDITPPKNVFVEVIATSTKGTIGEVVGFPDLSTVVENEQLYGYSGKLEIRIAGRDKTSNIDSNHCRFLTDYTGPTKWVRNVKKHKKEIFPPHVNKFSQTIEKGDWIIGSGHGKKLVYGKVVKWSKSSIWVTTDTISKKPKTKIITYPNQSMVLPYMEDPDKMNEQHLMLLTLKGWNGSQ